MVVEKPGTDAGGPAQIATAIGARSPARGKSCDGVELWMTIRVVVFGTEMMIALHFLFPFVPNEFGMKGKGECKTMRKFFIAVVIRRRVWVNCGPAAPVNEEVKD